MLVGDRGVCFVVREEKAEDMDNATQSGATVVIIDDEPSIVDFIQLGLRYEGFAVHSASTGPSGLELVRRVKPDLLILEIMLPQLDGLSVLRRMRAEGVDVPILLLTARDELEHKVDGLNLGADDYLTKPFRFEELLSRARALLRCRTSEPRLVLQYAEVTMELDTRRVMRGDRPIELTPREFDLLRYFMEHPQRVLERQALLAGVWRVDFVGDPNVIDVYVRYLRYLRRKLDGADLI